VKDFTHMKVLAYVEPEIKEFASVIGLNAENFGKIRHNFSTWSEYAVAFAESLEFEYDNIRAEKL